MHAADCSMNAYGNNHAAPIHWLNHGVEWVRVVSRGCARVVENHRSLWRGFVMGSQRRLKIIHRNTHVKTPEKVGLTLELRARLQAVAP